METASSMTQKHRFVASMRTDLKDVDIIQSYTMHEGGNALSIRTVHQELL